MAAILVADFGQRERGFLEEGGNIFWRWEPIFFEGGEKIFLEMAGNMFWRREAIFFGGGEKIFLEERQAC